MARHLYPRHRLPTSRPRRLLPNAELDAPVKEILCSLLAGAALMFVLGLILSHIV